MPSAKKKKGGKKAVPLEVTKEMEKTSQDYSEDEFTKEIS